MIAILSIALFLIFLGLSIIHFNWARGGIFGFETVIPTKENGDLVMKPRVIDSVMVGVWLLLFALFYLYKSTIFQFEIFTWISNYVGWIISIIFIARAVGDFRYVGFFKKVKQTKFAIADSKYFSPLCLFIGITGLIIENI